MPRDTSTLLRRLAPARRATATAGVTAAALVLGIGGYSLATSPALSDAPGALADLFGDTSQEVAAADVLDPAAREREQEQASRSLRAPLAAGLPSTSAQAQDWVDEVDELEATLAEVAVVEEAARVAAEAEAARLAAEEAARVAAEEEAARLAAEEAAAEAARAERAEAEAAAAAAPVDPGSNRALGQSLLQAQGFGGDQWSCLDNLWQKESGWSHRADNPSSSAYGIPQALPGSKMSSAGSDWETNPETQIRWGLGYIADRYGTPCAAWSHSQAHNWY